MSLPKGAIWQRIRQTALDAIPTGAVVSFKSPVSLAHWQATGSYTVVPRSSSSIKIQVGATDFGGALFSDARLHLDHALEHQVTLLKGIGSGQWTSPAWQLVTFYYWAYTCAMAFSRMVGHSVWFLTADVAKQFSRLAPPGAFGLGTGTYELACEAETTAGFREVVLTKRKRRVHELIWSTVFRFLTKVVDEIGLGNALPEEERVYSALLETMKAFGPEWPSSLRNIVNYRPGFAYVAPRLSGSFQFSSFLTSREQELTSVLGRLENATIAAKGQSDDFQRAKLQSRMLVDFTILINRLALDLNDDLADRLAIDRRIAESRRRFSRTHGAEAWPT